MSGQVFERIERLLDDHGKTQQNLLAALGMNRSTYSNWKLGKSESYLKHIDEIARFLKVSPGYLLRGIEDGPEEGTRAAIEDEMLRVFRKLSPKKQECVIQVARTLVSEGLGNEE
jgi:transcriptional regulator with XRE-family HTH domain